MQSSSRLIHIATPPATPQAPVAFNLLIHFNPSPLEVIPHFIHISLRLPQTVPDSPLNLPSPSEAKTMSSNVGLSTPRGSGTSGYVQRNLSHFRPRDSPTNTFQSHDPKFRYSESQQDKFRHQQRQPDQQILNHDRLREIEVKVFDLQDKLEDEGWV